MSLQSRLDIKLSSLMLGSGDFAPPKSDLLWEKFVTMATGTGLGLADVRFSDTRIVAAGATDSLDLAGGGLLDALGAAFAPARLKGIFVYAYPANTVALELTVHANGVKWFSVAGNVILPPSGVFGLWQPSAAGSVVTAGTADLVNIVAQAGSGNQTFDIHLIGASA